MQEITPAFIDEVYEKASLMISNEELMQALDKMADHMREVLKDQNPVLLTVMNGGLMCTAELAKRLNFPLEMDYIHATRYTGEVSGSSSIHWKHEPPEDLLVNRVIVVIDDILDGGLTLSAVKDYCEARGASKVYTAAMLDKYEAREPGALAQADFTGLKIENKYVFGFGLDYHEYLRNVPAIYSVAEEHMF